MATDLDKTEAGILILVAAGVAYLLYKGTHVVSDVVSSAASAVQDAATSLKTDIGPPVGTVPSSNPSDPNYVPDDILARQPWYQSALSFFGVNSDSAGQQSTQPTVPEGAPSP